MVVVEGSLHYKERKKERKKIMMWYIIEKWPCTDPNFVCNEDGEAFSTNTQKAAEKYAEEECQPEMWTVIEL